MTPEKQWLGSKVSSWVMIKGLDFMYWRYIPSFSRDCTTPWRAALFFFPTPELSTTKGSCLGLTGNTFLKQNASFALPFRQETNLFITQRLFLFFLWWTGKWGSCTLYSPFKAPALPLPALSIVIPTKN